VANYWQGFGPKGPSQTEVTEAKYMTGSVEQHQSNVVRRTRSGADQILKFRITIVWIRLKCPF
jgi:hypothetical protein